MKPRAHGVASWAIVAVLAGCSPAHGSIDQTGYRNSVYGYSVPSSQADIVGQDWAIDNFYGDRDSWTEKKGREYTTTYKFDSNGDGYLELDEEAFLYDLRFIHRKHDAVLWLRTFPIAHSLRERELRVLMQAYVDEVAGAGYVAVRFLGSPAVEEKRFAAAIVDSGATRVAGLEAFVATIEVANIDQIKLTPGQRTTRVRLAIIRTPFIHRTPYDTEFPVLMVAGYANLPVDFNADLPAFDRLLGSIQVKGQRGSSAVTLSPVTAPSSPSPSAPTAPAPAPAPVQPAASPSPETPATSAPKEGASESSPVP